METAKFYVYGNSPEDIARAVIAASQDETHRFSLFSWDENKNAPAEDSFLTVLHPTALEAMRIAAGADTLQALAGGGSESLDRAAQFLAAGAVKNPYRWFAHNQDDGFSEVRDETADHATDDSKEDTSGAMLALTALPLGMSLGKSGDSAGFERAPGVRIGFLDSEGPTQIHRMPGRHGGPTFLRRNRLKEVLGSPTSNRNFRVHVIVVDQGMDPDFVNAMGDDGPYGSHRTYGRILWRRRPVQPRPVRGLLPTEHTDRYRSRPQWHAHMIVRNILAIAGDNRGLQGTVTEQQKKMIRIYDVPVVPDQVTTVTDPSSPFGTAEHIWFQYKAIESFVNFMDADDRAIIVNAWGVKDRFRETPLGALTEKRRHKLNQAIRGLAQNPNVAVVFAAGNNGLFTADPAAGALDRGPGRSIFLPAALKPVWAAGASDANGTWVGLSSQGPPAHDSRVEKPDVNVPSHFSEDLDAHVSNTGSSASCGVLAGVLAEYWREKHNKLPSKPGRFRKAKKRGHLKRSNRLGHGIPQRLILD